MKQQNSKKPYKFNKFQKAWLAALESEEYKKTKHALCKLGKNSKESYCCLGVACEVYNQISRKKDRLKIFKGDGTKQYGGCYGVLPTPIQKKIKLDESGSFLGSLRMDHSSLIELNDDANWSHKRIAAFVRKNAHRLFTDGGSYEE